MEQENQKLKKELEDWCGKVQELEDKLEEKEVQIENLKFDIAELISRLEQLEDDANDEPRHMPFP